MVNGYVVPPLVNDPDHVGTLTALAGNCSSGRSASLARFSWKFDVEARLEQEAVPGPPDVGPPPLMADGAGTIGIVGAPAPAAGGESAACAEAAAPSGASTPRGAVKAAVTTASLNLFIFPPSGARRTTTC
jgi:hypothetical protein